MGVLRRAPVVGVDAVDRQVSFQVRQMRVRWRYERYIPATIAKAVPLLPPPPLLSSPTVDPPACSIG
jgi:hypothetical protein